MHKNTLLLFCSTTTQQLSVPKNKMLDKTGEKFAHYRPTVCLCCINICPGAYKMVGVLCGCNTVTVLELLFAADIHL